MKQTGRKGTGAMPRRKFDEIYQRHAVELTLHGDRTVKVVAKELGLPAPRNRTVNELEANAVNFDGQGL